MSIVRKDSFMCVISGFKGKKIHIEIESGLILPSFIKNFSFSEYEVTLDRDYKTDDCDTYAIDIFRGKCKDFWIPVTDWYFSNNEILFQFRCLVEHIKETSEGGYDYFPYTEKIDQEFTMIFLSGDFNSYLAFLSETLTTKFKFHEKFYPRMHITFVL